MLFWITFFVILYIVHKLYTKRAPLQLNSNSVIVITGAAQGLGRLTALELARRFKSKFILLDIQDDKFKTVIEELQALGSEATAYRCDLSSIDSMNDVIALIRSKTTSIDVLINNAGIVIPKKWDDHSYNHHLKTIQVNYLAPVHLTVALRDILKGHIVTIASVASLLRGHKLTSYVASKHAIYGFYNCLRVELVSTGNRTLTTSMVCPYAINTGMFEGFETRLNKIIPMLEEKYVANVIADTCVSREEVVFIPFYAGFVIKLLSVFPEHWLDKLYAYMDTSHYTNNPGLKKHA
jgi:all-trans-retinol dehydrogenase (NAD+)